LHRTESPQPIGQQLQLGGFEDRVADDAALTVTLNALEVQPDLAPKRTAQSAVARRTDKARRPVRFDQRRFTLLIPQWLVT
jgi:hypothetical protein